MKKLINILAISFICFLSMSCIKDFPPKHDIVGFWKLDSSFDGKIMIINNDLSGIRITKKRIWDCNFFKKDGLFKALPYEYVGSVLSINDGEYIYDAEAVGHTLIFINPETNYINVFVRYNQEQIVAVQLLGCF